MAQRQSKYMREIDFIFYNAEAIRDAVRKEKMMTSTSAFLSERRGSGISDPTALTVIKRLTPLKSVRITGGAIIEYPERWLEVVDKTNSHCAKKKDCRLEVAKRRYRGEDYRKTCQELNISNAHRMRLLEKFKTYAVMLAIQFGLMRV